MTSGNDPSPSSAELRREQEDERILAREHKRANQLRMLRHLIDELSAIGIDNGDLHDAYSDIVTDYIDDLGLSEAAADDYAARLHEFTDARAWREHQRKERD